jgi:hypothetical protein
MTGPASEIYEKTLVSYVDVLGFADLLKNRSSNEVARLLSTIKRTLAQGGRVHRTRKDEIIKIFKAFNFSDLIVRTTKILPGADLGEILDWEFYYLSEIQLSLAIEGTLIRGAICLGDLVAGSQDSIVFGPALVKAYILEHDYAVYPRIVVDRDLIWQAQEKAFEPILRDSYTRGEDGAYFVDYLFGASLTGLVAGVPGEQPDSEGRLEAHRNLIEKFVEDRIRNQAGEISERTKQKWIWLALYHNSTIERLKVRLDGHPRGANLDRFQIREDLLRF